MKGEKTIVETPLMKQYFAVKAKYPDAIILFRVGDFYETFDKDAVLASKILGIVLTKRSNGAAAYVDLAGFPHHSIDLYLPKLVRAGHKVAVCDQLEDPKLTKKIVRRGVTELVTPGVAYNEQLLPQKENNFLAAIHFYKDKAGIAFLDISTGTFKVSEGDLDYIDLLISNFNPKEILVQKGFEKGVKERFGTNIYISSMDEWAFVFDSSYQKLRKHFCIDSLKGFGVENLPLGITAAGAILYYLENNQQAYSDYCPGRSLKHICSISRIDEGEFVWLDKFTISNLELFAPSSLNGVSLLDILDNTSSPMGGRLMRNWLAMPSKNIEEIKGRHDVVEKLVSDQELISLARVQLGAIGDLERIISRAAAGRVTPREVVQLRKGLDRIPSIKEHFNDLAPDLDDCLQLRKILIAKIKEDTAGQIGKGEVISSGVDSMLDDLRNIVHNGKKILLDIQEREIARTGISSLKISYNNVFGYYLEVRNTHKDKVPEDWIRKQTLVSAERYITQELKDYEEKILGAEEKIYKLESEIFASVVEQIQSNISTIQKNANILAQFDCLVSFAYNAVSYNYCRPLLNDSAEIKIKGGRHPVIERLMPEGEEYVSNDLILDNVQQIIILTGPNMAGKSALLRQTALIVLMAQIGSFVPAHLAEIGYVDKIFTRVGASDNISRGESTFMVEMLETATILHNISPRSLILLDEIGRGTSTFDGMSIAWAIVEYIHEKGGGAKTLFATHYHELNDLANKYRRVKNYHISVKEVDGKVLFLRKLCKGGVAHSFGIHVARLAGMPYDVIASAEKKLRSLENEKVKYSKNKNMNNEEEAIQLSLFQIEDPLLLDIKETLEKTDLNTMSPMDTFDLIRGLKKKIGI